MKRLGSRRFSVNYVRRDKVEERAGEDEQVPDRVRPGAVLFQIEIAAGGVRQPAVNQESNYRRGRGFNQRSDGENNHPAHEQVQRHGNVLGMILQNGVDEYTRQRQRPVDAENRPADPVGHQRQGECRVRPGNEQVNGAVVENLKLRF